MLTGCQVSQYCNYYDNKAIDGKRAAIVIRICLLCVQEVRSEIAGLRIQPGFQNLVGFSSGSGSIISVSIIKDINFIDFMTKEKS